MTNKTHIHDATTILIQAVGHPEAEQHIQARIKKDERPPDRYYTALSYVRQQREREQEQEREQEEELVTDGGINHFVGDKDRYQHVDIHLCEECNEPFEIGDRVVCISDGWVVPDHEYDVDNRRFLHRDCYIDLVDIVREERLFEKYIDDLRHNSERRVSASFHTPTADQIADELEELIEQ